jgi:hypothetical protein
MDGLVAEMNTAELFNALDRLGNEVVLRHTKPAALEAAKAVQRDAQAHVRRRTGETASGIVIEEDYQRIGYIVRSEDVRSQASAAAQALLYRQFGRTGRRARVSAHENVPHVGIYLEYGTVNEGAHPFFWAAGRVNEPLFDRLIRDAVQDAIDEVGLG